MLLDNPIHPAFGHHHQVPLIRHPQKCGRSPRLFCVSDQDRKETSILPKGYYPCLENAELGTVLMDSVFCYFLTPFPKCSQELLIICKMIMFAYLFISPIQPAFLNIIGRQINCCFSTFF